MITVETTNEPGKQPRAAFIAEDGTLIAEMTLVESEQVNLRATVPVHVDEIDDLS